MKHSEALGQYITLATYETHSATEETGARLIAIVKQLLFCQVFI